MIAKAEPVLMCPITGTPCTGPTKPKPKRARKRNAKTPAWARPIEELSADKTPAWERPAVKRRKTLKMGEVAAWIREHPEWVAGRLVSDQLGVVYYSYWGPKHKMRYEWVFEPSRRSAENRAGFKEYATFTELAEAQRAA